MNAPVIAARHAAPVTFAGGLVRRLSPAVRRDLHARYDRVDALLYQPGVTLDDVRGELIEIRDAIPAPVQFEQALSVLARAIDVAAPPDHALDMVSSFLAGFGRPANESTGTHTAALLAVITDDDFDEPDNAPPISIEAIGLAIVELRRTAIFAPVPSEFRRACINARDRIIRKRMDLVEAADDLLPLRERIELDLADDGATCWATDREVVGA